MADIIPGTESLLFLPNDVAFDQRGVVDDEYQNPSPEEFLSLHESLAEEEDHDDHHQDENYVTELLSMHETDTESDHDHHDYDYHDNDTVKTPQRDTDHSIRNSVSNNEAWPTSPVITTGLRNGFVSNDKICHGTSTSTSHTSNFVILASHMLYLLIVTITTSTNV